MKMSEYLVEINNEHLSFFTPAGEVKALNDVSLFVREGEALGIVGESGSGKSVTSGSLMGITPDPGKLLSGTIEFNGHRIDQMTEKEMRKIRGKEISMIFQDPMTSCGCFECICGMEPASMGVVIVNREYPGSTPLGMSFADLASMTGGGQQTPGFMGHGKQFIGSKKFMRAEGGLGRIVWMPSKLKEEVAEALNASAKTLYGIDNFTDMVCDETVAASADDLDKMLEFLNEKGHPVLSMEPFDI